MMKERDEVNVMLKKVYSKDGNVDFHLYEKLDIKGIMDLIVRGAKIKWVGEKKKYKCIARDDRYIIIAKPFNLYKDSCQYSIIDTETMQCNRDNLIFHTYDYLTIEDCKKALKRLNDSNDEFGLSIRGIVGVKDTVEEIWCDCEIANKR